MINPILLMRNSLAFKQQPQPKQKPKKQQSNFAEVLAQVMEKK